MANRNLNNNQFVNVYRGRAHFWDWQRPKQDQGLHGLGMHWTTDPKVAEHHGAGWNDPEDDFWRGERSHGRSPLDMGGHVLEGRVAAEHIVQPHTDEWHQLAGEHGIMESGSEKEVTIRPGAPVEVIGLYKVRADRRKANAPSKFGPTKTRRVSSFKGGMGQA